ncbi:MAG: bifunctional proline dehydrogenase/L-glutamate gamma-semialdehyde dehydrogenase [bacterium]|nr:bifunctional proline dehydrogenase/L-glutamate gamma-semialdehyde dehydrogenase [bacterium]
MRNDNVTDYFTFEMIDGMANHVRRTIQETGQELVVYAPVATQKQFIHAIAYLIRRLDENTGPRNFLRHLNQLQTHKRSWQFLTGHFKSSIKHKKQSAGLPHRNQNRLTEKFSDKMGPLIHPPRNDPAKAMTKLETGESRALKPNNIAGNPQMWTPGIKWGVKPGSYTHMTEFFGPLLGVMSAKNLKPTIDMVNQMTELNRICAKVSAPFIAIAIITTMNFRVRLTIFTYAARIIFCAIFRWAS